MSALKSDYRFKPIRGLEADLLNNVPHTEGALLVATDTGKMWLDTPHKRVALAGSGASLLYGVAQVQQVADEGGNFTYLLSIDELEDPSVKVQINDLVLNSDGAFYRVLEVDEEESLLICSRLAVSGTGGGGGGSGVARGMNIKLVTPENTSLLNGQSFSITFTVNSAVDSEGEPTDDTLTTIIYLDADDGTGNYTNYWKSSALTVANGVATTYPLTDYLRESTTTKIRIEASDSEGNTKTKQQIISTNSLSLSMSASFSTYTMYSPNNLTLSCEAVGSMAKILKFYVDEELLHSARLSASSQNTQTFKVPENVATHGYHSVKIELYQAIVVGDEWREGELLPSLDFEVCVADPDGEDPIIWLGEYQSEYYNYDTIQIPFLIYDPMTTTGYSTVSFKKNGNVISERSVANASASTKSWQIFEIADADVDMVNYYSIQTGSTERTFSFTVSQDPNRSMELVQQNQLILNFEAAGRSNDESDTNKVIIKDAITKQPISASFNNFNWYNNGWILDSDRKTCLRISNGASLNLNIGQMTLNEASVERQSVTFEIQFKVRNVQTYDNLITNITRYKSDSEYYNAFRAQTKYNNYDSFLHDWLPENTEISYDDLEFDRVQKDINIDKTVVKYFSGVSPNLVGFGIGPQDAFFSNGTDIVNISFIENKMINLSMVYSYSDRRLYIYNNGVITGVIANSSPATSFTIAAQMVEFNSTFCDIDLYKFRIYKTNLNVNEIVQNYAVDRKDIKTFDQNGLALANSTLNEYQFSYEKMLEYNRNNPNNPLMPYVIYDTSRYVNTNKDKMSYAKKVKIPIDFEFVNTPLDVAYRNGQLLELVIAEGKVSATASAEDKEAAVKDYYFHHCPSFVGINVEMAVQGTSSQFYPRRNYKIKTKTKFDSDGVERVHIFLSGGPYAEDFAADYEATAGFTKYIDDNDEPIVLKSAVPFFYMDNYVVGTTKFTMKIDYMESSGTYNTGFANLVANAYSKHPLKDYSNAGAFSSTSYALSNGAFDPGVTYYADAKGKTKVKPTEAEYTPGTYYVAQYSPYSFQNLDSYRTSVQGFRVLAFHKTAKLMTSGSHYQFIGMYNMNIDKGSDEMYGFKPDKTIVNNFLKKKAVSKLTECWEFENNSRGFCSFRDPWNRYEMSFKGPDDEWFEARSDLYSKNNSLNGDEAPVIVDSFEYRYNANDDAIDSVLEVKSAIADQTVVDAIQEDYGVDIYNSAEAAGDLILDWYKNWEKAVKWVWSTCTDNVASLGHYEPIEVGLATWSTGTFYTRTINSETGEFNYELDNSAERQPDVVYYKRVERATEAGTVYEYENAYIADYVYQANKYYVKNEANNVETYALDTNATFDETRDYYQLIEDTDETLARKAARLIVKDTGSEFDPEAEYYTYDGSITLKELINPNSDLTPTVRVDLTEDDWVADTYYVGTEVVYNGNTYRWDTQEYRAAKYFNELSKHFDIEYMATYMIMTEVFECYDSRGKNLMMASWGPLESGGDYIWYPIFYDIDTQLGINNTGIPSFAFNVDATEDGNYSTSDSVLWNNFYNYFKKSYILQKYRHLKGITTGVPWSTLSNPPLQSVNFIESWYETDPVVCNSIAMKGERPMIATNLDAWYKYLTITNNRGVSTGETGKMNDNGDFDTDTAGTYFYALQGDRSLSRQQFLINRIEYIDSWLNEGNYQRGGANRIRGRVAANNPGRKNAANPKTSDKWVATNDDPYFTTGTTKAHDFDAEYWLNLTPIRSSYVTVSDDNEAYPSQKYDGINPVRFNITAIENGVKNSMNFPEQLLYVYGMNQMADLGEMHNLYWQEFEISGDATKLTTLKLGYDGLSTTDMGDDNQPEKWFNKNMNLPTIPGSAEDTYGGMPLLQEVNLCNITINAGSPTMDFTSCEKLRNLRATGSNYSNFLFADGVALDTLYLPTTMTQLSLTEANLLTKLITEYHTPTRNATSGKLEAEPGLYLEGMFEENQTNLNQISLIGGSLGYDSYKLIKKWYDIKEAAYAENPSNTETNQLTLTDVEWSPYIKLVEGDEYVSANANKYFKDNGHYGLVPYVWVSTSQFQIDVANGEVYKKNNTTDEVIHQIVDAEMLNKFIDSAHYRGATSTIPNITGIIYVDNDVAVEEKADIKDKLVKYYPKVTFFFKTVTPCYSAKFIIQEADGTYTYVAHTNTNIIEPSIQKIAHIVDGANGFENPYLLYNPTKDNFDFHGWSTTNNDDGLIASADATQAEQIAAWNALELDDGQVDFVFYAVFTIHEWNIRFFNGDSPSSVSEIASYKVPHGSLLRDPNLLPSRNESDLADTEKYIFAGWSQNINGMVASSKSSAKVTQLNTILASQDMNWYPVYYKGSVYSSVLDDKFLTFTRGAGVDYINNTQVSGYVVEFNRYNASSNPDGYDPSVLHGKITLPSYHDGLPVVKVGSSAFQGCNFVTHVFFENNNPMGNCQVVEFAEYAFNSMAQLKKFYFPDSLKTINRYCISNTPCLELTEIGGNINMIYQYGFVNAGSPTYADDLYLGGNIVWLAPRALQAYGSGIKTLYIGSPTEPAQIREYDSDHTYSGSQIGSIIFSNAQTCIPTNGIVVYCSAVDKPYFDNWAANHLFDPGLVSNITVTVV